MELDVSEGWKTMKSETFDDGRQLIMKHHKGDCELVEIFNDWHCAHLRFDRLKDLIK
jgi:hypothetical protein